MGSPVPAAVGPSRDGVWVNPRARGWTVGAGRADGTGGTDGGCRWFHARLPGYRPTPVRDVPALAERLGVGAVLVKDESSRFDLPAFKILGASWGAYRALCLRLGGQPR
ncbi:MAG TPA: hypothetical protein VFX70_01740 [Mycobacteriales bacterium]|nr:hypothetical protein [Mycobacteriales bacterium]